MTTSNPQTPQPPKSDPARRDRDPDDGRVSKGPDNPLPGEPGGPSPAPREERDTREERDKDQDRKR